MTLSLDCTGGSGATFYTLQFFEDGIGYETASVYKFALQDGKTSGTFAETKYNMQHQVYQLLFFQV